MTAFRGIYPSPSDRISSMSSVWPYRQSLILRYVHNQRNEYESGKCLTLNERGGTNLPTRPI
ncbi:unnamed protein product [Nesidiocoris tenuis]|uniref:Uncharacterized protein n=1 Tax=Nesidiocoris tenuis TaxID=355587 RepID=A0A6H5G3Q2_9HEMI|nr:unnamed protein product [Nesidiocoris tenuis]